MKLHEEQNNKRIVALYIICIDLLLTEDLHDMAWVYRDENIDNDERVNNNRIL